jgi:hypothetical protein
MKNEDPVRLQHSSASIKTAETHQELTAKLTVENHCTSTASLVRFSILGCKNISTSVASGSDIKPFNTIKLNQNLTRSFPCNFTKPINTKNKQILYDYDSWDHMASPQNQGDN